VTSPARGTALATSSSLVPAWIERPALEQLPMRQARWVAGSAAAGLALTMSPLWVARPDLALALALGFGASMVEGQRLYAAPLIAAAAVAGAWLLGALGASPVLGAGLAAGALATWQVQRRAETLDLVHGGLGSMIGAAVGLSAAQALIPAGLLAAPLTAALVAICAAQGLLPVALRFDSTDRIPTRRMVLRTLRSAYRAPVFKALTLFHSCSPRTLDSLTRRGLAEVAGWVYRLQITLQSRDQELASIDPEQVRARIAAHRARGADVDPASREPRAAAAHHLERLLEHRAQFEIERVHTEALVDYALAYLEEARAGLALARDLPGDAMPEGLREVLERLRSSADEGNARRRTARELTAL
jgi:hypothetical protein